MLGKLLKWKKTKLVFITGERSEEIAHFTFNLVNNFSTIKNINKLPKGLGKLILLRPQVLILIDNDFEMEKLEKFFNLFDEVIMVVSSKNSTRERKLAALLKRTSSLVVDHNTKKKIPGKRLSKYLSYGINKDADFQISDISVRDSLNFKINYEGSSIPVWLKKELGQESVFTITAALGAGVLLGYNFVSLTRQIER